MNAEPLTLATGEQRDRFIAWCKRTAALAPRSRLSSHLRQCANSAAGESFYADTPEYDDQDGAIRSAASTFGA